MIDFIPDERLKIFISSAQNKEGKFGLKLTKCTTLLKSLEQQGQIKREGNGKNTIYSAK